jgi:hypothetical protein
MIITDENITQSEGLSYDLANNATIYISVSNLQSTNAKTSYLYVYLKIGIPNTTTYSWYAILLKSHGEALIVAHPRSTIYIQPTK